MKLRIEPRGARKESYSGVVRDQGAGAGIVVLDFLMQRQELSKWCWAAISVSLGRYYGVARWQQHGVAGALMGFDCSRFREEPRVRARCNKYAMLDEALQLAGCYSHWSPGRPTFERIRAEIDAGRPVCLQIEWRRGGMHYAVVIGYDAGGELYVEDPLHGPSVQPFEKFPGGYRKGGGVWRGTYWTCPPADARGETAARPDGVGSSVAPGRGTGRARD